MKLKLRDGTVLQGTFAGIDSTADGETAARYAARYEDWRSREGTQLGAPALGETLVLAQGAVSAFRGDYRGFYVDSAAVRPIVGSGAGSLLLRPELQWVNGSGRKAFSPALLARMHQRVVPVRGQIGIDVGGTRRLVPYDGISSVNVRGVHSARSMLFLAGLAADVSILLFGSVGNPANLMN